VKLSVLDACFPVGRQSLGMAAMWLQWHVKNCGGQLVEPSKADALLATCVDPRNWKFLAAVKKAWPGKPLFAGGAGALSPYSLGLHCDAVCVGNGERFVSTLIANGIDAAKALPESWVAGEARPVEVAAGFPWLCPPIQSEDGAYRVWCGRGCKKKCAFCQTGWAMQYEENPHPAALFKSIDDLHAKNKPFAYLSNDPNQHSFASRLPAIDHGSYSLDFIKRNGLPSARQIRLGVEGVSERMRSLVGKPISHSDLVKSAAWLNANGKSVRWFMIAGLPGETAADWDELRQAVSDWKMACSKGVLALSFTAWQPEPATPLGVAPVDDGYWQRWESFRDWFFSGAGWSNRIKLMAPAAPKSRMESAIARMGLTAERLMVGGDWGPNDRVCYPFKSARNKAAQRYLDATGKQPEQAQTRLALGRRETD
jgi:hypothetical protein